tara:strand:+ start:300 stop:1214 length:915 start_codon:yes stop_codon:yes gene_type:complete
MIFFRYIIIPFIFFQTIEKSNYLEKIPDSNYSIDMVYIPAGEYKMGNDDKNSNTKISSFWISKYEVTWEVFNLFMEYENDYKLEFIVGNEKIKIDGISKPTTPYTDMTFGMGYEGYPAVNMTHFAASKFCKWLSLVSGNYYRLPTEAEWEYTCRAGSNSDYYFGDDINQIDNYAWHKNNSGDKYQKVGLKEPNKWGIYDMLGNVSEWVADSYEENIFKSKKLRSDPFIFNKSKYPKVYRGGSWNDEPDQLLTYKRFYSNSSLQERDPQIPKSKWWNTDAPNIGFRIVRVENIDSEPLRNKFWNN